MTRCDFCGGERRCADGDYCCTGGATDEVRRLVAECDPEDGKDCVITIAKLQEMLGVEE